MSISLQANPALLLIDLQKGFDDIAYWGGQRNNPDAEQHAALLLRRWRERGLPLFHVKHCSSNPNSPLQESLPGNEFKDELKPMGMEPVIKKNVNSAFIGTDLKVRLDLAGITTLVIVGLTTDHCISTTTRMAGNFGYDTYVVADATATFNKKEMNGQNYSAELMHETALASLHGEFATVVTTEFIKKSLLT